MAKFLWTLSGKASDVLEAIRAQLPKTPAQEVSLPKIVEGPLSPEGSKWVEKTILSKGLTGTQAIETLNFAKKIESLAKDAHGDNSVDWSNPICTESDPVIPVHGPSCMEEEAKAAKVSNLKRQAQWKDIQSSTGLTDGQMNKLLYIFTSTSLPSEQKVKGINEMKKFNSLKRNKFLSGKWSKISNYNKAFQTLCKWEEKRHIGNNIKFLKSTQWDGISNTMAKAIALDLLKRSKKEAESFGNDFDVLLEEDIDDVVANRIASYAENKYVSEIIPDEEEFRFNDNAPNQEYAAEQSNLVRDSISENQIISEEIARIKGEIEGAEQLLINCSPKMTVLLLKKIKSLKEDLSINWDYLKDNQQVINSELATEKKESYAQKDANKFAICDAVISDGVKGSSSYKYKSIYNSSFKKGSIVGISVNGKRNGRVPFSSTTIQGVVEQAIAVGVTTFVADAPQHRSRDFNIGEREAYSFFIANGFKVSESLDRTIFFKIR